MYFDVLAQLFCGAGLAAECISIESDPIDSLLETAGFVGCIETDEQLSTTYKGKIDFLGKCGSQS